MGNPAVLWNQVPYAGYNQDLLSPGISCWLTLKHSWHTVPFVDCYPNVLQVLQSFSGIYNIHQTADNYIYCCKIQCDIFNIFWAYIPESSFSFQKKKKKNNILGNILLKNNCTLLIEEKGAGTRSLTSSVQKDLEFVQSDTY